MGSRVASKVMKGAIAAGHPLTAQAGARVLEAGGSAVDACVAAAFVSWVCESPLTGPGGGGFMLVHEAESGRTVVLDFFVAVPRAAAVGRAFGAGGRFRRRYAAAVPDGCGGGGGSGDGAWVSRPRIAGGGGCRGRSSLRLRLRWRAKASS